jgi:phage shock protein PspC (stress-responsive transcriptional regulator)
MSPDRSRFGLDPHSKFLILVGLMIASIAALSAIPFMLPWGADLQNVHVYEHCTHGRSPYLIGGQECGDLWGRPFFYPPFLYAFFFWMRPLTLAATMRIWAIFLYAGFAAIFYVWARLIAPEAPARDDRTRYEVPVFCALLLFQYPFVFALERGSTDTVTVLFYTLGAYLFTRRRLWLAGAAAGIAAGFKLYPVLAVVVVVMSLLLALRSGERRVACGRQIGRWGWLQFGGGALAASAATLLAFPKDSLIYLRDVLPGFASMLTFACEFGHSVPTSVGAEYPGFAHLISVALLGLWAWAGARAIARGEEAWALAGALAICTYSPRTSYDYNLVTTYPLLLLLFLRARRTDRWSLLAFGLFSIAGDRRLFRMLNAQLLTAQLHLTLQLAFLAIAALVVAGGDAPAVDDGGRSAVAATPTAI